MDEDWLPIYEQYFDFTRTSGEVPVKCVLHGDSHASATVNLDTGLFYCHVCNLGGDAITLIMQAEGLNYVDAKRRAETIVTDGGGEVRSRLVFQRNGYNLPRVSRHQRRRRPYLPSWRRR